MIKIRIEEKKAFKVSGKKTFISGQHNEEFGTFWAQCHQDGTIQKLQKACLPSAQSVTQSSILGISRVEKDPMKRSFYFYIASENNLQDEESFIIPSGKWAIFSNEDNSPKGLIDCEMEAFMKWLPTSQYEHDLREELEVYPFNNQVEFWLPIKEK